MQELFDTRTIQEKLFDFFLERGVWVSEGHEEDVKRDYPEQYNQFLETIKPEQQ